MTILEGLTYDDVLLVPKYSTVASRNDVDLSVNLGKLRFSHPVVPANMKHVTGEKMARAITASGGLAILHRFMPIGEQLTIVSCLGDAGGKLVAVSIGVQDIDKSHLPMFYELGVRIFCIDIAHGDSKRCIEMISYMKEQFPDCTIIAGNVATGNGARRLWEAGADVVKAGVGPGSLCSTRIETGNGVPQLTALIDIHKVQQELLALERATKYPNEEKRTFPFIADGGIREAGDIVKALCFADMVMTGNLFAGCIEAPGNTVALDGITYKEYAGSSTHKTSRVEGVSALVPCKGSYQDILTKLLEGVQSGCSYQGAHNLQELKKNPQFIRITNAGLKESHPHDVILRQ